MMRCGLISVIFLLCYFNTNVPVSELYTFLTAVFVGWQLVGPQTKILSSVWRTLTYQTLLDYLQ